MSEWHREHPELAGTWADPWMQHESYRKALGSHLTGPDPLGPGRTDGRHDRGQPVSDMTMEQAHRRDQADKARIDDLRGKVEEFIADPPSRAHPRVLSMLQMSAVMLKSDADRVVQAWD